MGARRLSPSDGPTEDSSRRSQLRARIAEILVELTAGLRPGESLTAVSSLAAGADTAFAETIAAHGIIQQVFLPQTPDCFFNDDDFFDSTERLARAKASIGGNNVIEVRIVSDSPDRRTRFADCAYRIVHESSVLIAVVPAEEHGGGVIEKPGGTLETVRHASALGSPVYKIVLRDGLPVERPEQTKILSQNQEEVFSWPLDLAAASEPDPHALISALSAEANARARQQKAFFHGASGIVLFTHLTATAVAVWALAGFPHGIRTRWFKMGLLLGGILIYLFLHRRRPQRNWVDARLVAELCRSALSVRGLPGHLGYLREFYLPGCRGLVHSLNLMHLKSARTGTDAPAAFAESYLRQRVGDGGGTSDGGQIAHYRERSNRARRIRRSLESIFYGLTLVAIGCAALYAGIHFDEAHATVRERLGFWFVPIMFPVVASAAASWVSVLDLYRRDELYRSMIDFLHRQRLTIEMAMDNQAILVRAVHVTEHALLQEVAEWHAKHAH